MVKKKESDEIKKFLKGILYSKKVHWALTILIFLAILISSTSIRLSNIENLKSPVTGEYLSNDLDSLYFYRQAETQLELGYLPETDSLRSPGCNVEWALELIDNYLIWNYKILKIFVPEITFNYASTISAPIFYAIGLILFFILSLCLTKSKVASVLSSAFLAYAPAFLFRSIAGFYDHDHVGVFALFALMIVSYFALKSYEKSWKNTLIFGICLGFFTALVFTSWGGAITFVLVFLPLSFLLQYLFNSKEKDKFLVFYVIWIVFSTLCTSLLGSRANFMCSKLLDSQGILVLFVFAFCIVDYILSRSWKKLKFIKEKQIHLYSLVITIILGILGLYLVGRSPLELFRKAWATLIYPFFGEFTGRVGATVAENAQPFLIDLINQNGQLIFGFFILGVSILCWNFSSNSKKIAHRIILSGSMIFILAGILFSRISSSSLLNGENFISQALYALGGLGFLIGLSYVYQKEKFRVSVENIILFTISLTVAINARAAVRSFFLITPFICLIGGLGIREIVRKMSSLRDNDVKPLVWIVGIICVILVWISLFGIPFKENSVGRFQMASAQAKYVGPSANMQWQNAMVWVENETPNGSIFVHWWDYGYFVQTMGKRKTVSDGGRAQGEHTDHYIGRYVLTTPKPKTALSFMKTWNVSYLLIDPTEMGKYGAFSKIGSNDSWDRVSTGIFGGASDNSQMQETSTGFVKVYPLGGCVDGDISYYDNDGARVFLPGISISKTQQMECNSYIAGVIIEFEELEGKLSVKRPTGVFIYNRKQYRLPIKNVFIGGEMISFEDGIDSVIYLIPRIDENSNKIENTGAMIYLSPRTFDSLMGRLYILGDPFNEYPTLKEARVEDDMVVSYFKQFTGGKMNEFVWYRGLRAPLKIWKVDYPESIGVQEKFLDRNGAYEFGGLDYLFE